MLIHKAIFYSSFLLIPFLLILIGIVCKGWRRLTEKKILLGVLVINILGSLLFSYSRFVEPNVILTKTTEIRVGFSSKIVVISDLHLGVYKSSHFLKRIVTKINKMEDVDAVLIPGDFTYYAPKDLELLFSPLKDLRFPVYAVLGNHDSENPGPRIQEELRKALEANEVIFLHNSSSELKNKDITILGLGDKWANQDNVSQINDFQGETNLIVMAHNPDTVLTYENSIADLTVAGHTHGGQIRIPFIYKQMIPCTNDFDQGLYETENGYVFVSAGVGEIGLPMRFGVPPTIEILELY